MGFKEILEAGRVEVEEENDEEYAMVLPFGYEGIHICDALAFLCPDFRFREQAATFLGQYCQHVSWDALGLPGGGKEIISGNSAALKYVEMLCGRHQPKEIVLFHHQDCAAYGGSEVFGYNSRREKDFHKEELLRIRNTLIKFGIRVEIKLVYQRLIHNQNDIGFIVVRPEEMIEGCPESIYAEVA